MIDTIDNEYLSIETCLKSVSLHFITYFQFTCLRDRMLLSVLDLENSFTKACRVDLYSIFNISKIFCSSNQTVHLIIKSLIIN